MKDGFQKIQSFGLALASNIFLVWERLIDTILQIRFGKYGVSSERDAKSRFRILISAHSIEKALTLRLPRSEYGKDKIRDLLVMLKSYRHDDDARRIGIGVINAYLVWNKERISNSSFLAWLEAEFDEFVKHQEYDSSVYGGTRAVKVLLGEEERQAAVDFIYARYSCRSFSAALIEPDTVSRIIELAKRAPSQCNRQSSHAHCYQDRVTNGKLLDLQGGANGFRDEVRNLFVITGDMNAWSGRRERNQVFVDGALFASGVVSACTAYGIATCCLNLAITNKVESQIKKAGGIPRNERLIMMIAFGNAAQDHLIGACAYRLDNSALLHIH